MRTHPYKLRSQRARRRAAKFGYRLSKARGVDVWVVLYVAAGEPHIIAHTGDLAAVVSWLAGKGRW